MKRLLVIALLVAGWAAALRAEMTVYFIDVGQGDAEYIVLPNGKTALIDGGPSAKAIAAFIAEHGVTTIDYLVLTHPHADHYGGLRYVFDHCQVNNFYDTAVDNAASHGDEAVRRKAAMEPGCALHLPADGGTLDWGPGVTVLVLHAHPEPLSTRDNTEINGCSIVLKLTHEGTSLLLTGDIDLTQEEQLAGRYGDELSASILKVAHHGSRYASGDGFLALVRPERAYIEVGTPNRYGHPDGEALERLERVHARVLRTDQEGTMVCRLPGQASERRRGHGSHRRKNAAAHSLTDGKEKG